MDFDSIEPGLHLHHSDPVQEFEGARPGGLAHATIVFQRWTDLHLNYVLGASATIVPPSPWRIGLSTSPVSGLARNSIISVTVSGTNLNEIGSTTPAGYARQSIAATIGTGSVDWQASSFDNTLSTGGTSMVGDQVTMTFTGAPSPQGANSWFMGDGTTINAGNIYVAADTAATRNFANGDTEKVTATMKSG